MIRLLVLGGWTSATAAPTGYNVDHNRIQLGRGEVVWRHAVETIRAWQIFRMPWVGLHWPSAPIPVGPNVAVSVRHLGLFGNACRIVYMSMKKSHKAISFRLRYAG